MADMLIDYPKLKKILEETCEIELYKTEAEEMMEIVEKKLYDLFKIAYQNAKEENAETIKLRHIPLTKGFLDSMAMFEELLNSMNIDKLYIKKHVLAKIPGNDIPIDEESVDKLVVITGTLFIIVGRVAKAVFEDIDRIRKHHIKKVGEILDYTL